MKLHDLSPAKGATQSRKRVSRGPGSGLGKTAGRGHKGQGSRAGSRMRNDTSPLTDRLMIRRLSGQFSLPPPGT